MKRVKPNEFRRRLEVFEQVNVPTDRGYNVEWKPAFKLWCREKTIFREQLEGVKSGGNTLRDRKEFETRYTEKLSSKNRIKYRDEFYEISIVGDTVGDRKTVRFLGEVIRDGGV